MTKFKQKFFVYLIALALVLFFVVPAKAAGPCYCLLSTGENSLTAECRSASDCKDNPLYKSCELQIANGGTSADDVCKDKALQYNNDARGNVNTPNSSGSSNQGLASKLIPECVMQATLSEDCKDITIFLELMFNIIDYLFGIIGGVALLFFVYGGFVFILSEGSADRVAKGKGIIVAAILGIIISFSGYALVKFVGRIAGIDSTYQLK